MTNGEAFTLAEFSGTNEGVWTVPHLHRGFEESFFILDGGFTFTVGGEAIAASPGMYITFLGEPHTFSAAAGGGRFLLLLVPGGLEDVLRAGATAAKRDTRPGCTRGHLRPLRLDPGVAMTPEVFSRRPASCCPPAPSRRHLRHGRTDRLAAARVRSRRIRR